MSQIAQNVSVADTIKKNNARKATPTGSMTTTMMLILWYYIARFAFCDRYSVRKYGKKLSMVFSILITIMILWSQFSINLAATGEVQSIWNKKSSPDSFLISSVMLIMTFSCFDLPQGIE